MYRLLLALSFFAFSAMGEAVFVSEFSPTSGRVGSKPRLEEFGDLRLIPGSYHSYLRFSLPDRVGFTGFLVLTEGNANDSVYQEQRRLLARTYLAGKQVNFGLLGCSGTRDVLSTPSSLTIYLSSTCKITFWQEWRQ